MQSSLRVTVALGVAIKLLGPPLGVRSRLGRVNRAGVPEAAADVHCDLGRTEHDVDLAPKSGDDAAVEAVSKSPSVKLAP